MNIETNIYHLFDQSTSSWL